MPLIASSRAAEKLVSPPGSSSTTLSLAGTTIDNSYRTLSARATNGQVLPLALDNFDAGGTDWEEGYYTFNTGTPNTLTRTNVTDSSNGGAAVDFTVANKQVVATMSPNTDLFNLYSLLLQTASPGGRLTLSSGVPVTTSSVTAATSVYYTPAISNVIPLWDGLAWRPTEFTEDTIPLGTLTANLPYDIFVYLSGGSRVYEFSAWASDTARDVSLDFEGGKYYKAGDKTRLYLGSFYTSSATTTEDSTSSGYLFNAYNKANRRITIYENAFHNYTTTTERNWNGGTGLPINILLGLPTLVTNQLFVDAKNLVRTTGIIASDSLGPANASIDSRLGNTLSNFIGAGRYQALVKETGNTNGGFYAVRNTFTWEG